MSFTREHLIIDLFTERMRAEMITVAGAVFVPESTRVDNIAHRARFALSGALTSAYPRQFEIEVITATKIHITETTLVAEMGTSAPAPFDADVTIAVGVPFVIADSGLSGTLSAGYVAGDEWKVAAGLAAYTIADISNDPTAILDMQAPCITVFGFGGSQDPAMSGFKEYDYTMVVQLKVGREHMKNVSAYEMKGDIEKVIERDDHLWNNSICLSDSCSCTKSEIADLQSDGIVIFHIEASIQFRTKRKNPRAI